MKKIIIYIFLFFLAGINISYSNSDSLYSQALETNINSAKLIDNHVEKLINQLEGFKKKYEIYSDNNLNNTISELLKMSSGLKKIQNNNVGEGISSELIKTIIDRLKKINTDLSPYLRDQINLKKQETAKYINDYNPSLKSFSSKVKTIIKTLAEKIKGKEKLVKKEKRIVSHLKNMESYSKNIDNLDIDDFNTKNEVKKYIINNIYSIKTELTNIKNIIKE